MRHPANVALDAGCFFRGMRTLWDYGGTVSNFASVGPDTYLATNFGPGQIGLANVNLPKWSLANTQIGAKFEGVTMGRLNFSLWRTWTTAPSYRPSTAASAPSTPSPGSTRTPGPT